MKAAEAYTKRLGSHLVVQGGPGELEVVNRANRSLHKLHAQGVRMPTVVAVGTGLFTDPGYDKVPAFYNAQHDMIALNPNAEAWQPGGSAFIKADDPCCIDKRMYDEDWWSTPSPDHAINHEMGHATHFQQDGEGFITSGGVGHGFGNMAPDEIRIAKKVSGYAATKKCEFIAEVFAGMVIGKKWDAEVLQQYKKFNGPTVKGKA